MSYLSKQRNLLLGENNFHVENKILDADNLTTKEILILINRIQAHSVREGHLSFEDPAGDLVGEKLTDLDFFGVDFKDYNFHNIDMRRIKFGHSNKNLASSLIGANLSDSYISLTDFENCFLNEANLLNSEISGATFKNSSLRGVKANNTSFLSSKFIDLNEYDLAANFSEKTSFLSAQFNNCKNPFGVKSNLKNINFMDSKFNKTTLTKCLDLYGSNFFESEMKDSFFENINFTCTQMSMVEINNCSFKNSRFQASFFGHAKIADSDFREADLTEANFTEAVFKNCLFKEAIFIGANLGGAQFINCDFSGVDLRVTNKDQATFKGCTGLN